MKALVSDEFYHIMECISDKDYDADHVLTTMKQFIPAFAERYGTNYMKVIVIEANMNGSGMKDRREFVLYGEAPGKDDIVKELIFELPLNGYVRTEAYIKKDNPLWTEEAEKDYFVLSKLGYLVYGRARVMHELEIAETTDALTGIANGNMLNRYMWERLAEGNFSTFCANFVNIKNMKLLNSKYGEQGGNLLFFEYANSIKRFIGDDGCIARIGGDNFFILIKADREAELQRLLKKLQVDLKFPGSESSIPVKMDTRLGYYYIKDGDQISDAMNSSSIALKLAKNEGSPDYILYSDDMKIQMLKMKQLDERVPAAIENEELVVFYQPKVNISEESKCILCGAEALVRWRKNGIVIPPMEFIPFLEKNGLVTKVDFYVLEHVCRDIKSWEEKGIKPVRISSNFSRRHLGDPEFANKVEAVFRKYQVDPSYFEIEITESYDSEDMEALVQFEKRMHEIGVKLSVDDFGSGFSSLKMVKNIVSDTIKLDKSIIDGVGSDDKNNEIIVSHIIKMFRCLGKEVLAEGVETKEQAAFLRDNGCDLIQGYLYGKPIPREEFEENWLKKNSLRDV